MSNVQSISAPSFINNVNDAQFHLSGIRAIVTFLTHAVDPDLSEEKYDYDQRNGLSQILTDLSKRLEVLSDKIESIHEAE